MAAVGYANPYIGVESGDDVVLKRIGKGYTAAQAHAVLEKINASGLPYVVNFLRKRREGSTPLPRNDNEGFLTKEDSHSRTPISGLSIRSTR